MKVIRMQDGDGRGPFRPGFTHIWKGNTGFDMPAFYAELGWSADEIPKKINTGIGWLGCACADWKQFYRWFTINEIHVLSGHGFSVVEFVPDEVLFVTPTQVVFRHHSPLRGIGAVPVDAAIGIDGDAGL